MRHFEALMRQIEAAMLRFEAAARAGVCGSGLPHSDNDTVSFYY